MEGRLDVRRFLGRLLEGFVQGGLLVGLPLNVLADHDAVRDDWHPCGLAFDRLIGRQALHDANVNVVPVDSQTLQELVPRNSIFSAKKRDYPIRSRIICRHVDGARRQRDRMNSLELRGYGSLTVSLSSSLFVSLPHLFPSVVVATICS